MNSSSLSYNTERDDMVIPEYGRNVQNMIAVAKSIDDKEERNRCAQAIIKVMGQLNPHLRDVEDFNHKLWAHLFIMSNFELDVDSPYPIPSKESFTSKPALMDYPQRRIKYGHYGKIAEDWIKAASEMKDGEEKDALVLRLANMLKASYLIWNKDAVENSVIVKNLQEMSNGSLTISEEKLAETSDLLKNFKRSSKGGNNNKRKNKRRKSK
ncbi:DUF4290 domain-containing protein [Parvicella tangerina]|uniref:DUF4290 domain-containing protein n=1 Tax=Parvicella tangerina TaxID=2829795 RepID=A0A916JSG4_9FLAO|nr:DUF4290 domain-containing protein [Parvicella tangerina]CAG5087015.1 hypothetical protein CRYO30217_03367 [Parvicella tangerina]